MDYTHLKVGIVHTFGMCIRRILMVTGNCMICIYVLWCKFSNFEENDEKWYCLAFLCPQKCTDGRFFYK